MVIKGAPEIISKIIGVDSYLAEVATQQARGRRAITAAVINSTDFTKVKEELEAEKQLTNCTYIGTWFIEDPVRPDVPVAIEKCYTAGIDVVMMTGDNIKTGSEIARQAGFTNIWAIEAKDFAEAIKNPQNGRAYPNVITRCTPTNKLDILQWMQAQNYVCAMTGDGVNDSPSLNHADVGIAMGTGTSVAKEAADIVLLDDAFPSIVTGVKWGRSLYKNIQNFLYLQLSINISACLIAIFSPLIGITMPFTVTQFLWINLVMDSLAAIALASEPADERVLLEKPRSKKEFIINKSLGKAIFGFGGFIWILCLVFLYSIEHTALLSQCGLDFLADNTKEENLTIFFATYMCINWWNMFNARVIGKNKSVFNGLLNNMKFVGTLIFILVVTYLIVQYGGTVFHTQKLSNETWLYIILLTSPICWVKELYFQLIGKTSK